VTLGSALKSDHGESSRSHRRRELARTADLWAIAVHGSRGSSSKDSTGEGGEEESVRTHVARLASQIDVQAAGQNHTGLHAAIVQESAEVVKDCPYDGMDSRCQRTVKPPVSGFRRPGVAG
jgi:hypothetical protein